MNMGFTTLLGIRSTQVFSLLEHSWFAFILSMIYMTLLGSVRLFVWAPRI
jgi:hypothetical protein